MVIPQSVLDKPPSAELRPGQEDTDTLPPYDVLDPILEAYVEQDDSVEEIAGCRLRPRDGPAPSPAWWTGPSTSAGSLRRA